MADFLIAFKITNANEGGYSNSPNDTGGETYMGVSRNNWPNWPGWKLIDQYKQTRGLYGINQTMAENPFMQQYIHDFYKQNFWNPLSLDQVNDQQIANAVYDFGVNAGIGNSGKQIQRACNIAHSDLIVDGKIGQHTIDAINNGNAEEIYNNFNDIRKTYYQGIVAHNPSQRQFLASWLSRIKPYID